MNPNQSIDSSNMHKSIYDFPGQMSEAISIGKKIKLINDHSFISNIVICGMGGSAIGGDLAKSLINDSLKVPIFFRFFVDPQKVFLSTIIKWDVKSTRRGLFRQKNWFQNDTPAIWS